MVSDAPCRGAAADADLGILLLHSFFTGSNNSVPVSGRADDAETGVVAGNFLFLLFGNAA